MSDKKRKYILLDNCDSLFEGRKDTSFRKALSEFQSSPNTTLRLVLTFKKKETREKILKIKPDGWIELEVNLDHNSVQDYLAQRKQDDPNSRLNWSAFWSFYESLHSRRCASPLLVSLSCDVWNTVSQKQQTFFEQLDEGIKNENGDIQKRTKSEIKRVEKAKSEQEDAPQELTVSKTEIIEIEEEIKSEIARSIAVNLLMQEKFQSLDDGLKCSLACLAVLSLELAGNQVATFSSQEINKVSQSVFKKPATLDALHKMNICSLIEGKYAFRHETFQKVAYHFALGRYSEHQKSLHQSAAQIFEERVIDSAWVDKVKWAISAAYQRIEEGDYKTAEDIIDTVDSDMRTQFLYLDYGNVRNHLADKLAGLSCLTTDQKKTQQENWADLGEINYQGLDDWDEAEKMARAAGGATSVPAAKLAQARAQARHLWKILIYEKQIDETIEPDAMSELCDKELDKSVKANAFGTNGMYRTRSEEYEEAVKSYEESGRLADEHKGEIITLVNDTKFKDKEITKFLVKRLELYAALDIARYQSNSASAAALKPSGPHAAVTALEVDLKNLDPDVLIPSRQEFQYINLNKVCLYLASGDIRKANALFSANSGELPSEAWLNQTINMMQGILHIYDDHPPFSTLNTILSNTEKYFFSIDPRGAAFARFNRVSARINRLLAEKYEGDKKQETIKILLELSNIRARPFWFRPADFKLDKILDFTKAILSDDSLSICIRERILEIYGRLDEADEQGLIAKVLNGLSLNAQSKEENDTKACDFARALAKVFTKLDESLESKEPIEKALARVFAWVLNESVGKNRLACEDADEDAERKNEENTNLNLADRFCKEILADTTPTQIESRKLLVCCDESEISGQLLQEIRIRCCHDILQEKYKDFINPKSSTDWLHEYSFAAKVVTYTSQKFAKRVNAEHEIEIDECLNLKEDDKPNWQQWEADVERYYMGLMWPLGKGGIWRAPFLMPRIVLMRSKPMLPSKDDVENMCKWLKRIEDRKDRE